MVTIIIENLIIFGIFAFLHFCKGLKKNSRFLEIEKVFVNKKGANYKKIREQFFAVFL